MSDRLSHASPPLLHLRREEAPIAAEGKLKTFADLNRFDKFWLFTGTRTVLVTARRVEKYGDRVRICWEMDGNKDGIVTFKADTLLPEPTERQPSSWEGLKPHVCMAIACFKQTEAWKKEQRGPSVQEVWDWLEGEGHRIDESDLRLLMQRMSSDGLLCQEAGRSKARRKTYALKDKGLQMVERQIKAS